MYCSDYRVRSYIYKAVSRNYQEQPALALQMALCYTIGFGVVRDESKASNILTHHNIAPQLLYDLTSQCLEQTMTHPSISLHKLWRISYVSCVDLSYLYLRQHKLKPAETQLVQELKDLEAALSRDTVLATVLETELSSIYEIQGRFQEAQDIQEQIVERNKRLFGENHLDTLASIARLASILYNRGLWEDARRLQVQTLEQAKKRYDSGNFEIISASCGLALTYIRQGQWLKAGETINQMGDFSRGEVSGSHPLMVPYHTCGIHSVLWEFQFHGVRHAFEVFLKYLSSSVLGNDHPAMLTWAALQASCLAKHEKWEEAELIEVQVLETRERLLGHNHPDTLQTMSSLATSLMHRGRLDEAEKLQAQAVIIQNEMLGRDHPDTLASFTNLASIYLAQSRWKDAVELEIENIKLKQVRLGECHHETLVSMINLVCAYRNQGRIEEATEGKKQILERCERSWMKVPYDAWIDLTNISVIMSQRGWWEETEGIQRQLVDMSVKEFGECESLTLTSKSVLASSLWRRGQWDAAEELQTQAIAIGRENSWDEYPVLLDCIDNLREMKAGLHKGVQRT
ncbi:TPR-like protein [Xylariaceae sp. AK1471]|nr:TPR-like protein [Xylariaceae sp. AK1471]